ncbi:MAG: hypothetical protein ACREDR_06060 [Blastocatellia bacterium]
MAHLRFSHEMLIPIRNGEIYLGMYELENWLRRICLAAYMVKYGKDWPTHVEQNLAGQIRKVSQRNQGLFYFQAEADDNLIWNAMFGQLRNLLLNDELWPIVGRLTHFDQQLLAAKLEELNHLRNLLAHNRAFSPGTEVIYRGLEIALMAGIGRFKEQVLYAQSNILDDDDPDPVNIVFQTQMENNDWSKFQAFISKTRLFYQFVSLPVERGLAHAYISGYRLMKYYSHLLDCILAFGASKDGDEYWVLVPIAVDPADVANISRTFTHNPDIWTEKPYVEQDPQYIAHPKLWVYDDRRPQPE